MQNSKKPHAGLTVANLQQSSVSNSRQRPRSRLTLTAMLGNGTQRTSNINSDAVRFEVLSAMTMKNTVFRDDAV
jgi:hypothetical protein